MPRRRADRPASWSRRVSVPLLRRVDRYDDGLRAEPSGELAQQLGSLERSTVHGDLVRARLEQGRRVGNRAHAASDGERNRETIGDPRDELDERFTPVQRRP